VLREHRLHDVVVWQQNTGAPAEDLAHVLLLAGCRHHPPGPSADPAASPEPIAVRRPPGYRSVWQHLAVATGLRHRSSGGGGALVPHPSAGGGYRGGIG
jgi:hypothetical protein